MLAFLSKTDFNSLAISLVAVTLVLVVVYVMGLERRLERRGWTVEEEPADDVELERLLKKIPPRHAPPESRAEELET